MLVAFLLADITSRWQLTFGQGSIVQLAFGIGAIIGALTIGWFADRFGRKWAIAGGGALFSLSAGAIAFIPDGNWVIFAILRFLVGFGYAGTGRRANSARRRTGANTSSHNHVYRRIHPGADCDHVGIGGIGCSLARVWLASNAPYAAEVYPVRLAALGSGLGQASSGFGKLIGPVVLALAAGTGNVISPLQPPASDPAWIRVTGPVCARNRYCVQLAWRRNES